MGAAIAGADKHKYGACRDLVPQKDEARRGIEREPYLREANLLSRTTDNLG